MTSLRFQALQNHFAIQLWFVEINQSILVNVYNCFRIDQLTTKWILYQKQKPKISPFYWSKFEVSRKLIVFFYCNNTFDMTKKKRESLVSKPRFNERKYALLQYTIRVCAGKLHDPIEPTDKMGSDWD